MRWLHAQLGVSWCSSRASVGSAIQLALWAWYSCGLTIAGAVRDACVVARRGRLGTVCARGACPAWSSGPSTSPLAAMRIFNAAVGDPMLLDSAQGLRLLHQRLAGFLNSGAQEASFPALTSGDPAPYTEFLVGLRLRQDPQRSQLWIADDRWLELSAPWAELQKFVQKFVGLTDGDHHH